jgi:membrane protease YdiL (CAAX protease family)
MFIVFATALSKYLDPNAYKGHGSDLAIILILQAVAFLFTGLFEEILYRGFILNALLSK